MGFVEFSVLITCVKTYKSPSTSQIYIYAISLLHLEAFICSNYVIILLVTSFLFMVPKHNVLNYFFCVKLWYYNIFYAVFYCGSFCITNWIDRAKAVKISYNVVVWQPIQILILHC